MAQKLSSGLIVVVTGSFNCRTSTYWSSNPSFGATSLRVGLNYKAGGSKVFFDFSDLLSGKLAWDAEIHLYGCNTANGLNNLSKVLSSVLPRTAITGNTTEITFIPGLPWRNYSKGGNPATYLRGRLVP